MTAFNTSDLPATVTTVEALVIWGCDLLSELNPQETVNEGIGRTEYQFTTTDFKGNDDFQYWQGRVTIRLSGSPADAVKRWQRATEVKNATIPLRYKS